MKKKHLIALLFSAFMVLSSCGGSSNSGSTPTYPSGGDQPVEPVEPGEGGEGEGGEEGGEGEHEDPPVITVTSIKVLDHKSEYEVGESFITPDVEATFSDGSSSLVEASFSGYDLSKEGNQTVTVSYLGVSTNFNISVKKTKETASIALANELGKVNNLDGISKNIDIFTFTFDKGSSTSTIFSSKDNGGYLALYEGSSFTLNSPNRDVTHIEIQLIKGKNITASIGIGSTNESIYSWDGYSREITFTMNEQIRFNNIAITYKLSDYVDPVIEGVSTISEVYEIAKTMEFYPNDAGWYKSSTIVKLRVEALDAIDSGSESTSLGYDPLARGKILVHDNTGYIICSSSTTSNPVSFYHRVKEYLKAGTTQYTITGNISILNGVIEINIESYGYDSSIQIDHDLSRHVKEVFNERESYLEDVLPLSTTDKGYAVNKVVKFEGLSYFNKYNSAGSYLFIDKNGKVVPIYSFLDKDRTSLVKGGCYDIIALESMYRNRPSLRILSISKSKSNFIDFNYYQDAVELNDVSPLIDINPDKNMDAYKISELTVYKADVYVSMFLNDDKYTFNTSYSYDYVNKCYTTGTTKEKASIYHSLLVSNEDATYNQLFADYLLNNCNSDLEAQNSILTVYFTLSYLDTANHEYMWRANVIEDALFGLDYLYSESANMTFDLSLSNVSCEYIDKEYQTWLDSSSGLVVGNNATETSSISRSTEYLKVNDGTSLSISFLDTTKKIVGFTLYTGTYSHIAGFGDLEIETYRQFSSYTLVILYEPLTTVEIDDLAVSYTGNTDYLKVTGVTVNYIVEK